MWAQIEVKVSLNSFLCPSSHLGVEREKTFIFLVEDFGLRLLMLKVGFWQLELGFGTFEVRFGSKSGPWLSL